MQGDAVSSGFACSLRRFSAGLVGLSQGKSTQKCRQRRRKCASGILETRPNNRLYRIVDHSSRMIAIYNGTKGFTGAFVDYAPTQGLETILYPFPRLNTGSSPRPYPLNLIDAIMESPTYLSSRPIELSDLPSDFNRRLSVAIFNLSQHP